MPGYGASKTRVTAPVSRASMPEAAMTACGSIWAKHYVLETITFSPVGFVLQNLEVLPVPEECAALPQTAVASHRGISASCAAKARRATLAIHHLPASQKCPLTYADLS